MKPDRGRSKAQTSAPEDPQDQRDDDGEDEAGNDGEMEAEACACDMDVAGQAAERQPVQPGPGQPRGEQHEAEDDEEFLHDPDSAAGVADGARASEKETSKNRRERQQF